MPPLPTSPMPREPPPGIAPTLLNDIIPTIVPPPAVPRRHHTNAVNTSDHPNTVNVTDPITNFPQVQSYSFPFLKLR